VDGDGERTEVLKDCAVAEESDDGDSEETSPIGARRPKRECPIPKPGGLVGEILGFKESRGDGKRERPP